MALDNVENFARTSLNEDITNSETSVTVSDASVLPDPANGEYNIVVWNDGSNPNPADDPNAEIMRVTGLSSNTLTVTRGQENTSGVSHSSGHAVANLLTAKMINDIDTELSNTSSYIWRGDWVNGNTYSVDDVVQHDGSGYICIQDHTASSTEEPGAGSNQDAYWDLLVQGVQSSSGTPGSFNAYDSSGGTDVTNTATVAIGTVRENNGSLVSYNSNVFTLDKGVKVEVKFYVSTINSSNGSRSSSQAWLEKDTGSGWTEISGTRINLYNRNDSEGRATGTGTLIYSASTGDKLRVRATRVGGSDSISTIANGSGIVINELASAGPQGPKGEKGEPGTINSNAIITESEGISNNDNDSSIPTSAAVLDAINSGITGETASGITPPVPVAFDQIGRVSKASDAVGSGRFHGFANTNTSENTPEYLNSSRGYNSATANAGTYRLLTVFINAQPDSVTWGGDTMTKLAEVTNTGFDFGDGQDMSVWYLPIGDSGSNETKNFSYTNGSPSEGVYGVYEGVRQSSPVAAQDSDTSKSSTIDHNTSGVRVFQFVREDSNDFYGLTGDQGQNRREFFEQNDNARPTWYLFDVSADTLKESTYSVSSSGSASSAIFSAELISAQTSTTSIKKPQNICGGFSGLNTGSEYYLQSDNTISTSAGSNNIKVGVAISSTELLIVQN